MNRFTIRLTSLLMTFCLLADPALASIAEARLAPPTPSLQLNVERFQEEAVPPVPLWCEHTLARFVLAVFRVRESAALLLHLSRLKKITAAGGVPFSVPVGVTDVAAPSAATTESFHERSNFLRRFSKWVWVISGLAAGWKIGSRLIQPTEIPPVDESALRQALLKEGLFRDPVRAGNTSLYLDFADDSPETAQAVAKLLLASEERSRKNWSVAEKVLFEAHLRHPDHFARAIGRIIQRNPWTLIARDSNGVIVGVVFTAMVDAKHVYDLPETAVAMTHGHERDYGKERNAFVDFWFTGKDGAVAEAMIDASLNVVRAVNSKHLRGMRIRRMFAYSNPRALHVHPKLSARKYAKLLVISKKIIERVKDAAVLERLLLKVAINFHIGEGITDLSTLKKLMRDPAISFHMGKKARLAWLFFKAYPQITIPGGKEKQKRSNAIGSGYVFVMEYPLRLLDLAGFIAASVAIVLIVGSLITLHNQPAAVGASDHMLLQYAFVFTPGVFDKFRFWQRPAIPSFTSPPALEDPLAVQVVQTIHSAFNSYDERFREITLRARERFIRRDWAGRQSDDRERNTLYPQVMDYLGPELERLAPRETLLSPAFWDRVRREYVRTLADHPNPRLALTFFYSAKRRIFRSAGIPVDYSVEAIHRKSELKSRESVYRSYSVRSAHITAPLIERIVADADLGVSFKPLDLALAAERLDYELHQMSGVSFGKKIEILKPVFYRNKGAYLIGRIGEGATAIPFALSLLHEEQGRVDAVLTGRRDIGNLLLTSTRSSFQVDPVSYMRSVQFLHGLIEKERSHAPLLAAMGYVSNAKVDLSTELRRHLKKSGEHFVFAPGQEGVAMVVFTLPGFPYVFKVARDVPPFPLDSSMKIFHGKQAVIDKHRLVSEMDRVGRMLDPWIHRNYRVKKSLLSDEVLNALEKTAPGSIRLEGDEVIFDHVFIQRKVVPLDIYLNTTPEGEEKRRVLNDYAQCIKDLAAAGIWIGDYQTKNFGVTQGGRVVLYDFDDLDWLIHINFRVRPRPRNDAEEYWNEEADGVWFAVNEGDVFPETVFNFGGIHSDLSTARFWGDLANRIRGGELPSIFRYNRNRRLHLWIQLNRRLVSYTDAQKAYRDIIQPVMAYLRSETLGEEAIWVKDFFPPLDELKHLPLALKTFAEEMDQEWQARGWNTQLIDDDLFMLRRMSERPQIRSRLRRYLFFVTFAAATVVTTFQNWELAAQRAVTPAANVATAVSTKAPDPLRRRMRSDLFIHSDGIDFTTTVAALNDLGIFDVISGPRPFTMPDLMKHLETQGLHGNKGYLHVAMRLLADQGWITRNGLAGSDQLTFQLTDFGRIAVEPPYLRAYTGSAAFQKTFLSTPQSIDDFLSARNPLIIDPSLSYDRWVEQSENDFDLPTETNPTRQHVRDRVLAHLRGVVIGPTLVALADKGILKAFKDQPRVKWDVLKDRLGEANAHSVVRLLVHLKWAEVTHEDIYLTEQGKVATSLAWSYGVPVSYLPMLSQVRTLLVGNPSEVFKRDSGGFETHINRRINVLASGAAHRIYFEDIKPVIKNLFDRHYDKQPQFIADMGCGDGTFLKEVYEYILEHTYRGQLIRENPEKYKLWMVGADFNQIARQQTKKTLDEAGIPNHVLFGDINDPERLAHSLRARGLRPRWGFHTNTFLIHNAPYLDPVESKVLGAESDSAFVSPDPRYADQGYLVPNEKLEQKMVQFFQRWQPYIARFGMLSIELHAVPSAITATQMGKFPGTSYHATHFYSAQYLVGVMTYLRRAAEAGLTARWHKRIPDNLTDGHATISLTHFTAVPLNEIYAKQGFRGWVLHVRRGLDVFFGSSEPLQMHPPVKLILQAA